MPGSRICSLVVCKPTMAVVVAVDIVLVHVISQNEAALHAMLKRLSLGRTQTVHERLLGPSCHAASNCMETFVRPPRVDSVNRMILESLSTVRLVAAVVYPCHCQERVWSEHCIWFSCQRDTSCSDLEPLLTSIGA